LEVPAAPAAAAGCQAALHFIHEETLGDCWDARKRLCDDMYRGTLCSGWAVLLNETGLLHQIGLHMLCGP